MEPVVGDLACGWEGKGKLPAPEAIFAETLRMFAAGDLAGCRLLVTAGPTREDIDPVRYLSNYSSGKMGYAVAAAAAQRGAAVTLVSGPTCLAAPHNVELVRVNSALEMHRAVMQHAEGVDVVVKAAAVADYRPLDRAGQKLKKGRDDRLTLSLTKNPDILAELGRVKGKRLLIGFAAETEELLRHAAEKLQRKNLDLIVANDVSCEGAGFDVDTNIVKFLYADGRVEELPRMSKLEVAGELLDRIVALRSPD
jgi:phosphopantothenoylcysteine decarboxylase/phosphopantothenate--cysteine ligase